MLRRKDAMGYTTVVAAPAGASLGERYAAIASACALGERTRDQGGHALVVLDDLSCMVRGRRIASRQDIWVCLHPCQRAIDVHNHGCISEVQLVERTSAPEACAGVQALEQNAKLIAL